jgi:parvulin-like peptidyl-prolyl isomerase
MRPVFSLLCSVLVLASLVGCGKGWPGKERVLARVNGREITSGDLDAAMRRARPGETEGERPVEADGGLGDLKKSLLAELVEEELIIGAADKLGVSVSSDELKAEIALLKGDYDDKVLGEIVLRKYDSMSAWEDDVKRKLLVRKTTEAASGAGDQSTGGPTDAEISAYYNAHIEDYKKPERVRARMIMAATRADAVKAKARLKTESFDKVAAEMSTSPAEGGGPHRTGGGAGFFGRGDMPREFEDVLFSLEPGRASDVVETPYGFHIFIVDEKKPGSKLALGDVRESVRAKIRQEKADREFRRWMLELKSSATIEILEDL